MAGKIARRTRAAGMLVVLVLGTALVIIAATAAFARPSCRPIKRCDTVPPSVSISSPANGAVVANTVSIAGLASDNNSVARVDVSVDSGAFVSAGGTSSWSFSFDTKAYPNGTHTVKARATDVAGLTSTASISLTFENATVAPSPSPTPTSSPTPTPSPTPTSTLVGPQPISCSGVRIAAGSSIQSAIDANPGGTTFCVDPGTYRIAAPIIPKVGDKLIGQLGAVINGSRLLGGWVQSGATWYVGGQTQQSSPVGVCSTPGCDYNERVYFDNVSLRRASSLSGLAPGSYYFDYAADRIYIADNPAGHVVEASVAPRALLSWYDSVTVKNFVIEKFATPAQMGAVTAQASYWTVESNEVRLNHGIGIFSGANGVVRGNNVHHNGELGLAGQGVNQLIENNEIAFNNTEGFDTNWEGGGTKWVGTPGGLVVRGNYSHDNNGTGLWLDLDNTGALIESNLVTNNGTGGIVIEISCNTTVRNNTVTGSYAQRGYGAGIQVGSSHHVEVYGNTVSNNALGIQGDSPPRGSGSQCGAFDLHNFYVHDNKIQMSRGYTGVLAPNGDTAYYTGKNNRFAGNSYCVESTTAQRFFWQNNYLAWSQWQAYGLDTSGINTPLSLCPF